MTAFSTKSPIFAFSPVVVVARLGGLRNVDGRRRASTGVDAEVPDFRAWSQDVSKTVRIVEKLVGGDDVVDGGINGGRRGEFGAKLSSRRRAWSTTNFGLGEFFGDFEVRRGRRIAVTAVPVDFVALRGPIPLRCGLRRSVTAERLDVRTKREQLVEWRLGGSLSGAFRIFDLEILVLAAFKTFEES